MAATPPRTLYHFTHLNNLEGIESEGLDPAKATGELYAVWGCLTRRIGWALEHVAKKHKWAPDEMVLLRFTVDRDWTYLTKWDGVFYTPRNVPAECIEIQTGPHDWMKLSDYFDTPMEPVPVPTWN